MMENHFTYWATLTLFSVISMTALLDSYEDKENWTQEQRWAGAAVVISFILSALACFLHMGMKDIFAGQPLELGWVFLVLALWAAVLPTILDPVRPFAVALFGQVVIGNLFFASWGAFIMAMMITLSHMKALLKLDEKKYFFRWFGFAMSSLVVLWSTSRIWKNECDALGDSKRCSRTMFGLVLGAISFVAGLMLATLPVMMIVQQVMAILFFATWCVGVAYITYSEGPGAPVGSLYFASWFSLFFSFYVAAPEVLALYNSFMNQDAPATEGDNAGGTASKQEEGQAGAKAHDGDNEEEEVAAETA